MMFLMTRWSVATLWLVAVGGCLLLFAANNVAAPMLLLLGFIGLMPAIVMFMLSREAPQTTAEAIRDAKASR